MPSWGLGHPVSSEFILGVDRHQSVFVWTEAANIRIPDLPPPNATPTTIAGMDASRVFTAVPGAFGVLDQGGAWRMTPSRLIGFPRGSWSDGRVALVSTSLGMAVCELGSPP